ncbi:calcium-responsive transactivator [Oryzias latipes]|uniref:calcium-responsive transactivator n=1 Tax=Oryzias latipes TaxID=8090 RepID=UPI0009DA5AAF|nr:calcium-responsive transactivator [Oryzias latipes]
MSVAFSSVRPRSKAEMTPQTIQKMLDENHHLIQCIMDYQSKGKKAECTQYQQILHRNLVYLATIAGSNQNLQSLLPAPPTSCMSVGQSGAHGASNINDNIVMGLPPTSMMQTQMSNASMMHHQSAAPHCSSAQAGGQHYQGQHARGLMSQGSQGNTVMSQRSVGSFCSSQQGSAQPYYDQEEFYGEQYGHIQSSSEPLNQQYYADGHGEYSYLPSSSGEQGYERPFDEASQHYYEGGNTQYSQQHGQYQQGSGQQHPFSQQQYSSQQGYSGQPQGYGPGQGGSSQYSQYQQQYGSYRTPQGAQTQRPYSYDQGQFGNYQP